jgi:predicted nucleic acid-binding protein
LPGKHILDTCCFINFFASGHAAGILKAVGGTVAIPEAVKREALYLALPHPDEKPTPIDINNVITELKLEVVSPTSAGELALYIELAGALDDGEAMGLAIAKERSLTLMTDERKARKKAATLGVEVLTTSDVVAKWAAAVGETDVRDAVKRIGCLARYVPGPKDPRYDWWMRLASSDPA